MEEIRDVEDQQRSDDPTVVVCPRCGAENDTGYTYCRNCVNPMAAR